jgi:hypothetical protein
MGGRSLGLYIYIFSVLEAHQVFLIVIRERGISSYGHSTFVDFDLLIRFECFHAAFEVGGRVGHDTFVEGGDSDGRVPEVTLLPSGGCV